MKWYSLLNTYHRKASLTRKLLSLVLNGQRSVFFMSLQSAVWLRGVA